MLRKKNKKNNNRNFFLILIIISISILTPFIIFKDNLFVITSGSMEPTLNVGDLVIRGDKDPKDIKADEEDGDILILRGAEYFYEEGFDPIFWGNLRGDIPIIHRAIDKKRINGKWYFKTKGDNNLVADGGYTFKNKSDDYDYIVIEYNDSKVIYICETEVLGIVVFVIPYIGYLHIFFPVIIASIIGFFILYLALKLFNYEIRIIKLTNKKLNNGTFEKNSRRNQKPNMIIKKNNN